ncbi:alpha-2,3 sialyltransferase [Campylobacter sp. VicNov18]|uniref:alpha-2,3-sialyltransferase n=1 Tax=Campylobacter bilis TaxID=2691918 RepID=UPI00130EA5AB|nr:alpha-2,3-sialyltransferase [Campylobacter bilis]MPV63219.1 alpha-2,3 sialyltransferase [Campylobacter hepaticus]MBM0636718.1 alpha-2,3 sialyltransferase [Campylobacter bilis]MCC8277562.1 alpha-2,3 sialyltransferase [Campylobacter bilis]MCC8298767.1 alpha-2,3 sialyltransferase [Campylobacter bilis]MCC8300471.1 alpha-2,3 sialyltransferase [Campylobacter bilis]
MQKVIIAGNGPSLKEIDYTRLPLEYDVFRCNQFYFEDKYYLGKKCKAVFYNPTLFFEQYYTLKHLIDKKEYETELIICSNFNLTNIENANFSKNFYNYFPDVHLGYEFFKQLKQFDAYFKFHEIYFNQRITSGIYMCAIAIALGYKEIYLTGIDFYHNGSSYAFNTKQKNLLKLEPNFKNDNSHYFGHSKNTDIKALQFLKETYKVKFYCLCPNSPLANFIELAPHSSSAFKLQEKNNYIKDILLPSKEAYKNFPIDDEICEKPRLKENIYYKLIENLLRLPSDIKHYYRSRRTKCKK